MVGSLKCVSKLISVFYIASTLGIPFSVFGRPDGLYWHNARDNVCNTKECSVAAQKILSIMDADADPCEDFVQFACGKWMKETELPGTASKWGTFYELRDKVKTQMHDVMEMAKEDDEPLSVRYMKDMYEACMDEESIEATGYTYFLNNFIYNKFGGWPMVLGTQDESNFCFTCLAGFIGRYYAFHAVIGSYIYQDSKDINNNVIYIDHPSLVLARNMYLSQEHYTIYFDAYRTYVASLAKIFINQAQSNVAEDDITASVMRIIDTETKIASISTPAEDRRNVTKVYNPTTLAKLKEDYPHVDFVQYFENLFADTGVSITPTQRVINRDPDYFHALEKVLANGELSKIGLADYMVMRLVMSFAGEGPIELADLRFDFLSVTSGASEKPKRWSKCVDIAQDDYVGFGMAAGHVYVKEYFDYNSKAVASEMVEDIRSAFKELVTESTWMDEDTEVLAQEKADAMIKHIGYPDWIMNKTELDAYYDGIRAPQLLTHLENVLEAINKSTKRGLESLNEVPERDVWNTQPAIVNAFYSPNKNTITFPAGILQRPFFSAKVPRYLNYGGIGVVMGHEITHGFDDQGRQFDKEGNNRNWWSDDTIEAFVEHAQCFVDMYSNYTVEELIPILGEEDAHLNGVTTQGENIADNGGVREAYRAYKHADGNSDPLLPGLEMYTNEQMFFLSYGQVWCEIATTEALLNQVLTNPHSPGKFRIIGPLSNSEEFVKAYNCPNGSSMNKPDKCILW